MRNLENTTLAAEQAATGDRAQISRRGFSAAMLATLCGAAVRAAGATGDTAWRPRYVLGSCLYGQAPLTEILPEVAKTEASAIDVWPRVHGNQREQIDELGLEATRALLEKHAVKLEVLTRFDLGPFKLAEEIDVARQLGAHLIVCGGKGPKGLRGEDLKQAIADFVKRLEPTLVAAEQAGVTIGIENHADNLIESPDSLRWLADFAQGRPLGIALAPYHLPQDATQLATLIADLGPRLVHFYAWQHGDGATEKLPKERELLQLPGRGPLDFRPLLQALAKISYAGLTEIFMHPVPRGVPILDGTSQVTAEINRARAYLETLLPG